MTNEEPRIDRPSKRVAACAADSRLASVTVALGLLVSWPCLAQAPAAEQVPAASAPAAESAQPVDKPSVADSTVGINTETDDAGPAPRECMKANKTAYYGAAGMDAAVLLAFFLLLSVAAKRNWISTNPMTRFTTVLLPFATAAAALSGFVIFDKGTVSACMRSADLRSLLDVAGMAAWQRGMMLGMLPVIVLAFVIQFARKAISK